MSKRMICTNCCRTTTDTEALARKYNTGKCNHCGSELIEHTHPKQRDDLVPSHPPTMVSVGQLQKIISHRPELTKTLALGKRFIINEAIDLGDYQSIVLMGIEESLELMVDKKELVRFAEEVLAKVKP